MAEPLLAIGLMSGTSADGVDAALVHTDGEGRPRVLATHFQPYPAPLRQQVLELTVSGADELDRLGPLDRELGHRFAVSALEVCHAAHLPPAAIHLIGSHGQTVRHRPPLYTRQIGNPFVIAAQTGITTVADFRPADLARGGEGAPLTPLFHRCLFQEPGEAVAVVNLGGIANITALPADPAVPPAGGDSGPANALLDLWAEGVSGGRERYDREGRGAARGTVHAGALEWLLQHPYLARPFPKSTGREEFGPQLLERFIATFPHLGPDDRFATLTRFTAVTVADGCTRLLPPAPGRVVLCGGGACNPVLVEMVAQLLPASRVTTSTRLGVDESFLEAQAFAWLGVRTLRGLTGSLPAATGAAAPAVLGAIHPGLNWPHPLVGLLPPP